ncbi:MAG: aminotransferase class I/II-fold pyridoxal phosphate-dependent enzyme [Clostridiales bacterium]|nr:aminotransferase class I/II-fold pyridoxal phosphate-dependent enzyme [Clostridiales bacterium]
MQAIILAAGMGKRLKELTSNKTKCMVKVNGVSLIDRMLHQIEKYSLERIVIVVGYEGQHLMDYIGTLGIKTPIIFVNNPIYDKTNNIYSLALAKDYLKEDDTLLFESDLIFEDAVIDELLSDPRETLALVDKYESWMNGTCLRVDENDNIKDFISGKNVQYKEVVDYYKTVNIYKFSQRFSEKIYIPFLDAYENALGNNEYYEQVLKVITMLDDPEIKAKRLNGEKWYEIDDVQELDIAEALFCEDPAKRLKLIEQRYGGFWRFPKLVDYCYLVNPYFPPHMMVEEMIASFQTLLTQYPSGQRVNSLLAWNYFNIHQENIVVGNGAAELIKSLLGFLDGKTGFIRPTFEEYPHRFNADNSVFFDVSSMDYSYTADDIMAFFTENKVDNVVIINPDNPSGNFISKADMLRLVEWGKTNSVNIVLDESFIDFADDPDSSLLVQDIISGNPHLYLMKSISKSYGVPGLRLGILASGNKDIIAEIKKDVSIWNINSFAEFYLQIYIKYIKDYEKAKVLFRTERARFVKKLSEIEGIRVLPSQANFLLIELTSGITASKLTEKLLNEHNILIKDLTSKLGNDRFIRIAVKDTADNDKFLEALKESLMV